MRLLKYYAAIILGAAAWLEAQGVLTGSTSYTVLIAATAIGILWYLIAKTIEKTLDRKVPFSTPSSQALLDRLERQLALNRLKHYHTDADPKEKACGAPPEATTPTPPNIPIPERKRGLGYLHEPPTNPQK
jgi:hypothetical protein